MASYKTPSNEKIINDFRHRGGNEYEQSIPDPVKAGVAQSAFKLMSFVPVRNEFANHLVNRIGMDFVHFMAWRNKLAKFKRENMVYGDTIEEINVGLPEGSGYDPEAEALEKEIFGRVTPHVRTAFHHINRTQKYKITIQEPMLRRAFTQENGLGNLVASLMQAQITADERDEFLTMTNLFREWYRLGGFFRVNVPDVSNVDSESREAKTLLRRLREYAAVLQYPETDYNPSRMPVAVDPSDLELFITPEAKAAIDVEALAAAFNVSYAEFDSRTTTIPAKYMPIPGVQAILTTRQWFVVADTLYQTALAENPAGLYQNYWLHHHSIISASPFQPAILFYTGAGDTIEIPEYEPDTVTLSVTDLDGTPVTELERGEVYRMLSTVTTTPAGGPNTAVWYELDGGPYSDQTYVRQTGTLFIALDEEQSSITINGRATDEDWPVTIHPLTLPIVGTGVRFWPQPGVIDDEDGDGLIEVVPEAPIQDGNEVAVPDTLGVDYKNGATVVSGDTIVITESTTITATAQTGYEIKTGSTASWTFEPTP